MKDWVFKFPNYVSTATSETPEGLRLTVSFKYFFVTYWLVRWFHGPDKMRTARAYLERETGRPVVIP